MKQSGFILICVLIFIIGGILFVALGQAAGLVTFSKHKEAVVSKTFNQMVTEALNEVPTISPEEAYQKIKADSNTLIVDVRDPADIAVTGLIPGAINVTLGTLTYKADHEVPTEWRDPNFRDFNRPIITTCETGEMAALAGKLLKDMGYTNVKILKGATVAWKNAGYPTIE